MSRDVRYPCLFNLIKTFHPLVDPGCWMLNLAKFLPQSCLTTPIFNGSFSVHWLESHPGACFAKALALSTFLGRGGLGKCDLGNVFNFPRASAGCLLDLGKIKPLQHSLPEPLGCRGAGWWMLLRLGLWGEGQTQFHSVESETLGE